MICWRSSVAFLLALLCMVVVGLRANVFAGEESPAAETLVLESGDVLTGTSVGFDDGRLRWELPNGVVVSIPLEDIERLRISGEDDGSGGAEDGGTGGEGDGEMGGDAGAESDVEATEEPDAKAKGSAETPKAESVEEPVEEAAETKAPKADPEVKTAEATETAEPKATESEKADPEAEATAADEEAPPVLAEPLPITDAWYEAARSTYAFSKDQTGAWTKRFEFGGTWVEGNSNTSEGYVGGIFERKFDRAFYQIDWNGRHSTADEEVTQSRWNINGTTDFSRYDGAKWILFASNKHLFDQLADLNYRGTFASGIGYRFYDEDEKRLIARIGPGTTVEKYDPPVGTRTTFDVFAEIEARWPILDRTHLEYKSTFTPSVEDIAVFRIVSKYGLLIALDESKAWAMKLGLRHDLNSEPNPGLKKNDFTTTFSVVYSRK